MTSATPVPGDLVPADVVLAAAALAPLASVPDDDVRWSTLAPPTTWTAVHTIEHIGNALLFYAGQIARRATRRLPVLRNGRPGPAAEQLDLVLTSAHVLRAAVADLGADRAWHPSGVADASGWVGMAVTEILVHGVDAAQVLGVELPIPADVCARTVARVFPWALAPTGELASDPVQVLLGVTGRTEADHDPDWWWQSAPLAEWDGRPVRRTVPPGWR